MVRAVSSTPCPTYVVKRGQPVEKYEGYEKVAEYSANEQMGVCDCQGFTHRDHCKHLMFKMLLDQFKVDEFVFYGVEFGECHPRVEKEIMELGTILKEIIQKHFKYDILKLARLIQNPIDPTLYNCIEFDGSRKMHNVLVLGYFRGIMLVIRPIKEEASEPAKVAF
jgi:hypothetical protein